METAGNLALPEILRNTPWLLPEGPGILFQ